MKYNVVEAEAKLQDLRGSPEPKSSKHLTSKEEQNDGRLVLLYEVGKKVGTVSGLAPLIKQTMHMTQQSLNASASSLLLFDEEKQELFFKVAEGEAEEVLKRIRLDSQSGIAGWVAYHGKPLVINDIKKEPRFNKEIDKVTGFVTRSIICVPLVVNRKTIGVIEVLNKEDGSDFSEQDLETLVSVASTAAMAIENTRLHQSVVDGYKATIKALAAAIDAKDPYTCGHSQRVMEYALMGSGNLSLSREQLETLEYAGILHDVGKIGITDNILQKPGQLTPEEWDIMRQHSSIGANILKSVVFLEQARKLILHHHERYDGGGYPDGLKGEDIPIGARLLGVADAFDTMTTDRSYRVSSSVDHALGELGRCSGTQFCPVVVDAFVSSFNNHRKELLNPILKSNGQ